MFHFFSDEADIREERSDSGQRRLVWSEHKIDVLRMNLVYQVSKPAQIVFDAFRDASFNECLLIARQAEAIHLMWQIFWLYTEFNAMPCADSCDWTGKTTDWI